MFLESAGYALIFYAIIIFHRHMLLTRGVETGGITVYTPKISNCFVHVWDINICFEIAVTS